MIPKTCKLEYFIRNMKPATGDGIEAFNYKNALYLYERVSLRFESIFRRINELFIKNRYVKGGLNLWQMYM